LIEDIEDIEESKNEDVLGEMENFFALMEDPGQKAMNRVVSKATYFK
jgi:hypothetical protein